MGAINFFETCADVNPEEAFSKLALEALREYGSDPYSGTIATTSLRNYQQKRIAETYSKKAEDAAYEYARQHDFGEKWTSDYLDLGVKEYQITTVKKVRVPKDKQTATYQTVYAVVEDGTDRTLENFGVQAAAEAFAEKYCGQHHVSVQICKRKKLVSGSEALERFEATTRTQKKKPARIPKGVRVDEVHVYAFYGWAAT